MKRRRGQISGARTILRLVASLAVSAVLFVAVPASANHPDGCPQSEPGPENGTTTIIGTSADEQCLVGANGSDLVRGLGGDDRLVGNHGSDTLMGGPGDDRLWGGRGPDTFICGPGFDRVFNRRDAGADIVDASCEIVRGT